MTTTWQDRQQMGYYVVVRAWLEALDKDFGEISLLDVGCRDTPVATWGSYDHRYSIDLLDRPALPKVKAYTGDFLQFTLPDRMTVITCLQVLEHLGELTIQPFCKKLLASAEHVIVSVPYLWPAGDELRHQQDPVSLDKLIGWMDGRRPYEHVIVLDGKRLRLVARWIT